MNDVTCWCLLTLWLRPHFSSTLCWSSDSIIYHSGIFSVIVLGWGILLLLLLLLSLLCRKCWVWSEASSWSSPLLTLQLKKIKNWIYLVFASFKWTETHGCLSLFWWCHWLSVYGQSERFNSSDSSSVESEFIFILLTFFRPFISSHRSGDPRCDSGTTQGRGITWIIIQKNNSGVYWQESVDMIQWLFFF